MPTPSDPLDKLSAGPFGKLEASGGLAWALLSAVAALAVYANAVPNGFALDDVDLVEHNPRILSVTALPGLFVEPYWPGSPEHGLHRPLTVASFAINRALTGPGPTGFHAVNVLLHALVCFLLWSVARGSGVHYGTALATAWLFALHPLHTEAVANVAGRAELLAAAGVLAAWLCHRRARGTSRPLPWAAAAAACWWLALMSKEHAIMAPLVFALDDALTRRDPQPVFRLPSYAGYGIALALAGTLRFAALDGFRGASGMTAFIDHPAAFAGTLARIATALWVQVRYVGLFLWPAKLSSDYSYDAIPVVEGFGDLRLWIALFVLAAAAAMFVWAWRRSRPVALGLGVWCLFFLPASSLLFASGTVMAERLAYLPTVGGCLIVGHGLAWLASARSPLPRPRGAIAVVLALAAGLLLGIRTRDRNPDWKDNLTLAVTDARTTPRSAKLHAGAGIAEAAAGDTAAAEASFRRALEIYPDYAQVRFNLGQLLSFRGDHEEAIEHLARAAALSPDNPRPYKALAPLYEQAGHREQALAAYQAGARLDPNDLPLRFNYGRALLAAGRSEQAASVLEALSSDAAGTLIGDLAGAMQREARGDTERADQLYRALLDRNDLPPDIRRNIARRLEN